MNEAEISLIGCVLMDNDSLYEVYDRLRPEMFSVDIARDCYAEILALYDRGEKINLISVSCRLENGRRSPEDVRYFLGECVKSVQTTVEIKSYADVIIMEHRARSVRRLFERVSLRPKDIDGTIAEIMARCEELQSNMQVRSKSLKQIAKENSGNYFKDIDKHLTKTGLDGLDDCLGGLEGGDVVVVGARPGVGKSAIVTQICGNMAASGHRIGLYNLEMNESQIYERFVSRLAELSLTRVRRAKSFLGGEEEAFNKANEEMSAYDVVVSTGSKSVSEIRMESRNQNFDVIIIDYLQLIKADRRYANRSSEVGDISKAIKALAMELHIPIIVLSQLNRLSEQKETKEPTMAELRESGDIEQDASVVILLWNLSEDNRAYKCLNVAKQRQGETLKEGLIFDGDHMCFKEYTGSFEDFKKMAKDNLGSSGFQPAGDDTPFGGW